MGIQTGKLNQIARREVVDVLREIFSDPDLGLPVSTGAVRRLKKSVQSKKAGRVKDLKEVLGRYSGF